MRFGTVIGRLQHRFPEEPAERVSAVVTEVSGELETARIRDYVPLLVEKEALARLRFFWLNAARAARLAPSR